MFRRLAGDDAAEAAGKDVETPSPETRDAYFRLCMLHVTQRPYTAEELARLTPPAPGVFEHLVQVNRAAADLLPRAQGITCPTRVITGEFDPYATPEDAADLAAAIGPKAVAHIVPAAGHGGVPGQLGALRRAGPKVPWVATIVSGPQSLSAGGGLSAAGPGRAQQSPR